MVVRTYYADKLRMPSPMFPPYSNVIYTGPHITVIDGTLRGSIHISEAKDRPASFGRSISSQRHHPFSLHT